MPRPPEILADPVENVLAARRDMSAVRDGTGGVGVGAAQGVDDRRRARADSLLPAARRILRRRAAFSDSGLETVVVPRLRWMRVRIVPQAWIAGHRVDFLIGERLVLQIDGGHHVGSQRERDIAHDAQLMLLGYHVIRVGYGRSWTMARSAGRDHARGRTGPAPLADACVTGLHAAPWNRDSRSGFALGRPLRIRPRRLDCGPAERQSSTSMPSARASGTASAPPAAPTASPRAVTRVEV